MSSLVQTNSTSERWQSVASNNNGTKLVAVVYDGYIYTSTDSGKNWVQRNSGIKNWVSVASSSDGTKLVACNFGGYIYTSTDSGKNWVQRNSGIKYWYSVASSANGTKLVAVVSGGYIYTSNNSGQNWTEQTNSGIKYWNSVASSADGTKLVAVVSGGYIYTSTDSGQNWVQSDSDSLNWRSVASNNDGTKLVAVVEAYLTTGYIYTYAETIIPIQCFKEGSKILTDQGYKLIQNLRKGDLVKTLNHGFKPIELIGKREIHHPALKERIKDQLYQCSQDDFEEVFEPLVITGCHSILVDNFVSNEQREKVIEVNGNTYVTDRKYRLPACADPRASIYEIPGNYMIYHLALENNDYYMNYGIYANGLLVETCSKRYLKELSNMELIE